MWKSRRLLQQSKHVGWNSDPLGFHVIRWCRNTLRSLCLHKPSKGERWFNHSSPSRLLWFYRLERRGLYQSIVAGCYSRKGLIRTAIDFSKKKKKKHKGKKGQMLFELHWHSPRVFSFFVRASKSVQLCVTQKLPHKHKTHQKASYQRLAPILPPCFYPFIYLFIFKQVVFF